MLMMFRQTYNIMSVYTLQQDCKDEKEKHYGSIFGSMPTLKNLVAAEDLNGHVVVEWNGGKTQ